MSNPKLMPTGAEASHAAGRAKRFAWLFAGTAVGTYLAVRLPFGLAVSSRLDEELVLLAIALMGSMAVVAILTPLAAQLHRLPVAFRQPVLISVAVTTSVLLGLCVYVGLLGRPLAITLKGDWPFILMFGLCGVGYVAAHELIEHGSRR